jgi:hypothetical protein
MAEWASICGQADFAINIYFDSSLVALGREFRRACLVLVVQNRIAPWAIEAQDGVTVFCI